MTLTTVTSRTAAAVVAAVAGVISYGHIRAVATVVGETDLAARLIPLGIDGLIVVGTMAMLEDKRGQRRPRPSARFALGFGIIATILFNIGSAEPTWTGRAVAAVPALSFLIAVEVLARSGRKLKLTSPATDTLPAETLTEPATASVSAVDNPAPELATVPASRRRQPPRHKGRQSNADRVARAVARTPDATAAELASRLRLSERTVQRHWPAPPVDTVTTPNGVPADPQQAVH